MPLVTKELIVAATPQVNLIFPGVSKHNIPLNIESCEEQMKWSLKARTETQECMPSVSVQTIIFVWSSTVNLHVLELIFH